MTLAAAFLWTWMAPHLTQAKTFRCRAAETPCLIASMIEANTNGQKTNDIRLEAGTYTLTAVNNDTDGPNGLPSVTSTLTITGDGADTTIIAGNLQGRLVHAAASGTLTLEGLTLRGGNLPFSPSSSGAGIWNGGRVTLLNSILTRNFAWATAAGIENHGTLMLTNSTVAGNHANEGIGGIRNNGTVTLTNSALTDNSGGFEEGGIVNGGMLTLTNSTVAYNTGEAVGGITNYGTAILRNSTVAYNGGQYRGGIANGGTVMLQNTILALNRAWFYYGPVDPGGPDCSGGTITSLGNNLIGNLDGCPFNPQSTDLTGDSLLGLVDPEFGPFTEDGTPGDGHFPLLADSPAIDTGNDAACPKTDQLGEKRVGPCDIGAIEFQEEIVSSR